MISIDHNQYFRYNGYYLLNPSMPPAPQSWPELQPILPKDEIRRHKKVSFFRYFVVCIFVGCIVFMRPLITFLMTPLGICVLLIGLCFFIYAHIEPFFYRYTYHTIKVGEGFTPFTVVQLTDLHVHFPYPQVTERKLNKIVDQINSVGVDYVLLTGDCISRDRKRTRSSYNVDVITKTLGRITARKGKFAVLGNNDYRAADLVEKGLIEAGFVLLSGTVVKDDISFTGIGSEIFRRKSHQTHQQIEQPHSKLNVFLAHEPDVADEYCHLFDIQFSGHTHGGQCVCPFGVGPVIAPKMGKKYILGLYQVEKMLVHVSTGIGISPLPKPLVRFNNIPEVNFLSIVPKQTQKLV